MAQTNREIKFRGINASTGKWVYGYLVVTPIGQHRIYWQPFGEATNNTYHEVKPETVGQLVRRDGIYEGDVVEVTSDLYMEPN